MHIKTSVRFAVHRHLQVYKLPTCGNVHDLMEGVWISESFYQRTRISSIFLVGYGLLLKVQWKLYTLVVWIMLTY